MNWLYIFAGYGMIAMFLTVLFTIIIGIAALVAHLRNPLPKNSDTPDSENLSTRIIELEYKINKLYRMSDIAQERPNDSPASQWELKFEERPLVQITKELHRIADHLTCERTFDERVDAQVKCHRVYEEAQKRLQAERATASSKDK